MEPAEIIAAIEAGEFVLSDIQAIGAALFAKATTLQQLSADVSAMNAELAKAKADITGESD